MASELIRLIGEEARQVVNDLRDHELDDSKCDKVENDIEADSTISETDKQQLVKSRRGQGLFRTRVERIEKSCRVTGTSRRQHLIAGHIKPWSISTNAERLDGENGFLFSPHIDHLFDRGYISFSDDGKILISKEFDTEVLRQWGLSTDKHIGAFTNKQKTYLAYHRENVFKA